jgi:cytochrome c biogenesis protein CcmG/thiol:disulfide interchange protein DsbE
VKLLVLGLTLVLVAGCGGGEPKKPTFGGGTEPSGASTSELADLKAAAKIEGCPKSDAEAGPQSTLPDIAVDCLGGGRSVRLSGLAGTPMVINVWASWCAPCRKELPLLAKAHREYGDRVRIIGVDVNDAAPEAALRLADRSGVTYPQLADRKLRLRASLRITAVPQTVFVDERGRMVFTERAPFRSYADVTAAIRTHLGVAS